MAACFQDELVGVELCNNMKKPASSGGLLRDLYVDVA